MRADLAPAGTLLRVSAGCKLPLVKFAKESRLALYGTSSCLLLMEAGAPRKIRGQNRGRFEGRIDQLHWSGCTGSDSSRCTGSGASTSGAWLRFAGSCSLDQGQQSSCNSSGTCRGRYSAPHAAAAQHGTLAVFAARLCCTAFLRNFLHAFRHSLLHCTLYFRLRMSILSGKAGLMRCTKLSPVQILHAVRSRKNVVGCMCIRSPSSHAMKAGQTAGDSTSPLLCCALCLVSWLRGPQSSRPVWIALQSRRLPS